MRTRILTLALSASAAVLSGCAVTQPRGAGTEKYLHGGQGVEPYVYWLYMPPDMRPDEKLPTVVSLHGLKPFDSAKGQCREWQEEADSHRFAVVAPELRAPNILSPLPLDRVTGDLERDGRTVSSILASLSRRDWFDPDAVMVTSWSYGGYVAHWVANRYPNLFTALAVRQSNFNSEILDPSRLPEYRYRRVGVFSTSGDFGICRRESKQAAEWYSQHGFDVTFSTMEGRGHERIPAPAAGFFSRLVQLSSPMPAEALKEADRLARSDPKAFLGFCLKQVEGLVWDYRATFTKHERIGGELRKEQRIAVRFKRVPFSVHMTWVRNPGKASRVLYVKGRRVNQKGEEMALVEPSNIVLRLLASEVERPIRSLEARGESRKAVDQFGFANTLRLSLKYARPVAGSLKFVGDTEFGGRPVWHMRRTLPSGEPDHTLDLMVDKGMLVPLSAVTRDKDGELLGRYEFSDVALNVGYARDDFNDLGSAW